MILLIVCLSNRDIIVAPQPFEILTFRIGFHFSFFHQDLNEFDLSTPQILISFFKSFFLKINKYIKTFKNLKKI